MAIFQLCVFSRQPYVCEVVDKAAILVFGAVCSCMTGTFVFSAPGTEAVKCVPPRIFLWGRAGPESISMLCSGKTNG